METGLLQCIYTGSRDLYQWAVGLQHQRQRRLFARKIAVERMQCVCCSRRYCWKYEATRGWGWTLPACLKTLYICRKQMRNSGLPEYTQLAAMIAW